MYVKISSARVSTVYNSGAASANSSYNAGFAYDTSGNLQVDTAAVPSTESYNNGIARHSDGVLCVNTHDPSLIAYGFIPGSGANYFSTPDATANQITGDIDVRVYVASTDWTPSAAGTLAAKYGAGGSRSWLFYLNTDGKLHWVWSADGTTTTGDIASTVATGITDDTAKYVRVAFDVDNGAAGNDTYFYTSPDGIAWTQLGTTVTTATATTIFNSDATVTVGAHGGGGPGTSPITGKVYRAQIYNGIAGTLAVDFNAADWTETRTNGATQASGTTGETWTLNNAGADITMILAEARSHGGLFTDNNGALYVHVTDAVTSAIGGIPVTAKGAVAVSAVT